MEFEELLKLMVQKGGSDLFITAGVPPSMKVHGKILPVTKNALTPDMTRDIVFGVMTEKTAQGIRGKPRMQLRHLRPGHRPFPGIGLLPAQPGGHGAASYRDQDPQCG